MDAAVDRPAIPSSVPGNENRCGRLWMTNRSLWGARPAFSVDLGGAQLELGRKTLVMGILNVTPDSFADGGRYNVLDRAVAQAERMAEEGADLIDIGGESSRPAGPYGEGAQAVPEKEEIRRTVPVIEILTKRLDLPISIDTTKAGVAESALDAGACIVNDISALRFDPGMARVAADHGAVVVLMHMKGTPGTMQQNPVYDDLFGEILAFLAERRDAAVEAGVRQDRIMVDPGFGFGKRLEHNYQLLAGLGRFHDLDCPILVGPSRKQFVAAGMGLPPSERLEGTLAALALSAAGGAHVLRVHDVAAGVRAVALVDAVSRGIHEHQDPA
jgi:dihydropteroate synthase